MLAVPKEFANLLTTCAPLFTKRVWQQVQVLLVGAILAPGTRTITAVLRVMGLAHAKSFQQYHRVLNRAIWSSLEGSHLLWLLLVRLLAPTGPLVLGLDDTLERRRGAKIQAKGIYRDPVRSSPSHLVKASGLRWLSLMLLVPIAWAKCVGALPFLTVLAPSERYHQKRGQRHKKLTDWARQMLLVVRRWVPERPLVLVTASSFAVITLLWRVRQLSNPICCMTRLRLDAALYAPAPPRTPGQTGRPRLEGKRLPTLAHVLRDAAICWSTVRVRGWYGEPERVVEITSATAVWYHSGMPPLPIRWVLVRDPQGKFESQALLGTDLSVGPVQILEWFVLRWRLEVTWQEARAHLGLETQRQWNARAIIRTTPALLGLFSIVTLWAGQLAQEHALPVRPDFDTSRYIFPDERRSSLLHGKALRNGRLDTQPQFIDTWMMEIDLTKPISFSYHCIHVSA
jgi:DDE superfamily endonuclease